MNVPFTYFMCNWCAAYRLMRWDVQWRRWGDKFVMIMQSKGVTQLSVQWVTDPSTLEHGRRSRRDACLPYGHSAARTVDVQTTGCWRVTRTWNVGVHGRRAITVAEHRASTVTHDGGRDWTMTKWSVWRTSNPRSCSRSSRHRRKSVNFTGVIKTIVQQANVVVSSLAELYR